jgi:hypothetical protein
MKKASVKTTKKKETRSGRVKKAGGVKSAMAAGGFGLTGSVKAALESAGEEFAAKIKIPAEQWKLPAGYTADGARLATLEELANPAVPTMALVQMSPQQRAEVVAKRIELQPKFELAMVGAGVVDKERAISEVKAQTDVGRVLTEIEQNVINFMLEAASQKAAPEHAHA